jgi:hypothetical protein
LPSIDDPCGAPYCGHRRAAHTSAVELVDYGIGVVGHCRSCCDPEDGGSSSCDHDFWETLQTISEKDDCAVPNARWVNEIKEGPVCAHGIPAPHTACLSSDVLTESVSTTTEIHAAALAAVDGERIAHLEYAIRRFLENEDAFDVEHGSYKTYDERYGPLVESLREAIR